VCVSHPLVRMIDSTLVLKEWPWTVPIACDDDDECMGYVILKNVFNVYLKSCVRVFFNIYCFGNLFWDMLYTVCKPNVYWSGTDFSYGFLCSAFLGSFADMSLCTTFCECAKCCYLMNTYRNKVWRLWLVCKVCFNFVLIRLPEIHGAKVNGYKSKR
jgi:hypothetical protein